MGYFVISSLRNIFIDRVIFRLCVLLVILYCFNFSSNGFQWSTTNKLHFESKLQCSSPSHLINTFTLDCAIAWKIIVTSTSWCHMFQGICSVAWNTQECSARPRNWSTSTSRVFSTLTTTLTMSVLRSRDDP